MDILKVTENKKCKACKKEKAMAEFLKEMAFCFQCRKEWIEKKKK